jgi:hypothetical protein
MAVLIISGSSSNSNCSSRSTSSSINSSSIRINCSCSGGSIKSTVCPVTIKYYCISNIASIAQSQQHCELLWFAPFLSVFSSPAERSGIQFQHGGSRQDVS